MPQHQKKISYSGFYTQVNVPFSWELKPGVSKVTSEDSISSIDISHLMTVSLPPPPCLSKSARLCVDGLQGVINVPMSAKKGNLNEQEQDDPFVAAYRKCTEYSMRCKSGSDDENCACSGTIRTRKNTCALSCKYSCTVSSDNVVRVSHCFKEKGKEEHRGRK